MSYDKVRVNLEIRKHRVEERYIALLGDLAGPEASTPEKAIQNLALLIATTLRDFADEARMVHRSGRSGVVFAVAGNNTIN